MLWKRAAGSSWRRHFNPDGSLGGLVAESADVASNVYIDRSAIVAPHAVVLAGTTLQEGEIATPVGVISFRDNVSEG